MNDRNEEAVARLRAADPAAGAEPDLTRLRALVDARRAVPVTDLAGRRRARWALVAAVAAGGLLVGSAGFGLGRGTAPEPAPAAAPAITLGGAPTGAGQEGVTDQRDVATSIWPGPGIGERITFRAEGLAQDGGTAGAWTYDPTQSFTAERAAALAAAVGLAGEPRQQDGAWLVGTMDGTGAYLVLSPDGQTTVSFYDPATDPYTCALPEPAREPATGTEPAECRPAELGPAPGGDVAVDRMRTLLTAAGQDPAGFELTVEDPGGDGTAVSVSAFQIIDGQRSGATWYATLSGAGLFSFNGVLAPLVPLGDYPVISPTAAVDRLTDPRFGQLGGAWIMAEDAPAVLPGPAPDAGAGRAPAEPAPEDLAVTEPAPEDLAVTEPAPDTPAAPPTEPPSPASPGSAVPWPVEEVAITTARLGLAQYWTPAGAALLVPAYELGSADGRTWSVLALAEDALDLTS